MLLGALRRCRRPRLLYLLVVLIPLQLRPRDLLGTEGGLDSKAHTNTSFLPLPERHPNLLLKPNSNPPNRLLIFLPNSKLGFRCNRPMPPASTRALQNLIQFGDFITLLHVFPSSRSKNKSKTRLLRLKGFRLALSFKDICDSFPNTKVEMVVTEGDDEGKKIAAMVREIGASELVLGLHDHSFLYKLAMAQSNSIATHFMNCRVLAIKQPPSSPLKVNKASAAPTAATPILDSSNNLDFSQIDVAGLQIPDVPPPKIPYKICPNPYAIIWKSRRSRRRKYASK